MMEIVRSVTRNLAKALSSKYIYKLILIALVLNLFSFMSCIGRSSYAWADTFLCYENCRKALKDSPECIANVDYSITAPKGTKNITVLSIHGGKIEKHTSRISHDLWKRYAWYLYDFNGHTQKDSPGYKLDKSNLKNKNFSVLHITSTNFNESKAINLVESHENAVTIHGYSRNEEEAGIQTICVGSKNTDQIEKFIEYVNKESYKLKDRLKYSLNLVNAPLEQSNVQAKIKVSKRNTICLEKETPKQSALTGIDPTNIVNKAMNPNGGLQIELNEQIREDLAKGIDKPSSSSPDEYQLLRNVIYRAINYAMLDREN